MVALLHPNSENARTSAGRNTRTDTSGSLGIAGDFSVPGVEVLGRPKLRLVVDNSAEESPEGGQLSGFFPDVEASLVWTALVIAVVVFGSLFVVRTMQGAPAGDAPVQTGGAGSLVAAAGGLATPDYSAPVRGDGDGVVLAKAGDSMWSIAVALAPNSDPRPVVTALIEANGTDSVQIGQQIVIPEQLLD